MAFNPASISGGSGGIKDGDTGGAITKGGSTNQGIVFLPRHNIPTRQTGAIDSGENNSLVYLGLAGLAVYAFYRFKKAKR